MESGRVSSIRREERIAMHRKERNELRAIAAWLKTIR